MIIEWYLLIAFLMPSGDTEIAIRDAPFRTRDLCMQYTAIEMHKDMPWLVKLQEDIHYKPMCLKQELETI